MPRELGQSSTAIEKQSADRDTVGKVKRFLETYTWVLYVIAFALVHFVIGYGLDVWAGPMTPETQLLHEISGIFMAVGIILGFVLVVIGIIWAVLVYKESRIR
ncbi:hypothetical protein HLRTI_002681 [Halorhabdus tiamatea SARL4B]|uniref:Uncharacterized protein n=1 Tax=Halorhabdus tiamatea SARL4B TaxID=1033806 RepID=F7PLJ1_9EURY|nr:hypothetical protein [Halorhabdus tiamatea]ERJ05325.1 hypothetical protein HLRTI_002681 [Halorhabdus tiamatea SARL4B]CCQ33189.1 hypothetical protein HTIA_1051 [Halorhabdus tiamatea SARL4B]